MRPSSRSATTCSPASDDFRAGDRHPGARGLCRRPRRPDPRPALRRRQPELRPDGRPRRPRSISPSSARSTSPGQTFRSVREDLEQRVAQPDDRHERQRVGRRDALDPRIRAGRGVPAGLVHGQRALDDHECALRQRRRHGDRFAAQHPAQAQGAARQPARPLRPAAARRHERRRAPPAGRRDLHPAGRQDDHGHRRSAPAGDLRGRERDHAARKLVELAGGLDARGGPVTRAARAHRREQRSASRSTWTCRGPTAQAAALAFPATCCACCRSAWCSRTRCVLEGHVYRPGAMQYRPGMRISRRRSARSTS